MSDVLCLSKICSGGFCYMRQELDSSDTVLFPEEVFGKVCNVYYMLVVVDMD